MHQIKECKNRKNPNLQAIKIKNMHLELKSLFENELKSAIHEIKPEAGGSINEVFKVTDKSAREWLVKMNQAKTFPQMFEKECFALTELASKGLHVPENPTVYRVKEMQFLTMKYYSHVALTHQHWFKAGENLANLHTKSSETFGWEHDNFMGTLVQLNHAQSDFYSFYRENRIEPLVKMCRDQNLLNSNHVQQTEKLFLRIEEIIPPEKPACIHGDLWRGNILTTKQGCVFIDPAAAFSHREFDMAMTMLFETFPKEFYEGYQATFPLEKGWQQRVDVFNLYPLLVHLKLFGGSYLSQVSQILRPF